MTHIPAPYGEWQEHQGGERPCDLQQAVEVRRRNNTVEGLLAATTCWTWKPVRHGDTAGTIRDIIAWRTIPFEYVARMDTNLYYLQREAHLFHLTVNPHHHEMVLVELYASRGGEWLNEHQQAEAITLDRMMEAVVSPYQGAGATILYGTDMPCLVAEAARVCRELKQQGVD